MIDRCGDIPVEFVESHRFEKEVAAFSISQGKRILYLTRTKDDRVKPCPGTAAPYLCCRYTVIDVITQCPMDCSYCILQCYLDRPVITMFVNLTDIVDGMHRRIEQEPHRYFRFGTGELSDSLVLEPLTEVSRSLALAFGPAANGLIEFKTKTDTVDGLLDLPQSNVIMSWSLNPEKIVKEEERGTASVEARLKAAKKCAKNGLLLGFHFDPILSFPGWENAYQQLIDRLFEQIKGHRIVWVSLGSLRYPPPLRSVIEQRHPQKRIFTEEMIRGQDGKMRYPRPLRTEMYRRLYGWLRAKDPELFVYLCMESPAVWNDVLGRTPDSNEDLDYWFARHLFERFPELGLSPPEKEAYRKQTTASCRTL